MLRSLRFRLPALFLAGVVVSGLVASLLAIRFFQQETRARAASELRQEATGLVALYIRHAGDIPLDTRLVEQTAGDDLFFSGINEGIELFPGQPALTLLPRSVVDHDRVERRELITFTLEWGGRKYLAAAHALVPDGTTYLGAMIVARPENELRSRWVTLAERLALAFLVGLGVSALLAWYLSRRITEPVLKLSDAADEIAAGRRDVDLPPSRSGDEVGHLAARFGEMAARLRETEELERNFLMTVSHELRTPLTAIRGHVEALREGVVADPELRAKSLDVIAQEAVRLERLVGDVLDLAKLDAHRFTVLHEEVEMDRLLQHAYSSFGEEARRRAIDYRQEVRAHPVLDTDGDRVLQIITNLLANAFRWTPDGGRIGVELAAENGNVSVAIEDSGPGIPEQERDRIWRPFYSGDGASGTGLGLAIARELALALGGRIDVDSAPGRGSRFELVLPVRRA
jgi:two-component system OmpR family sensor kinase